jgi:hypothetical protein
MSKYSIDSSTLVNIADAIRTKDGSKDAIQVSDFASRIKNIAGNVDIQDLFNNAKYIAYLDYQGLLDKYYTEDSIQLTLYPHDETMSYVLYNSQIAEDIDLTIDVSNISGSASSYTSISSLLYNSTRLKKLNFHVTGLENLQRAGISSIANFCYGCTNLEEINDDAFNFKPSQPESIFYNCYNLKYLPNLTFIRQLSSNSVWKLNSLCNLRKAELPISLCSNLSYFTAPVFTDCGMLESIVHIDTGESYTNGSNLYSLLDLKNIGYFSTEDIAKQVNDIANGIIPRVTNDEEYAQYKDGEYWTTDIAYSHYNKIAVLETFNSLPNVSNFSRTMKIQLKGDMGSATDGGAINTLTEEEIAVATAKGWTVTIS